MATNIEAEQRNGLSPRPGIVNSVFLFPNEPIPQSTHYCSEAAMGGLGRI